ncbi:MAG TPA: hypothetical protein VFF24_09470 [Acidimicrobiia bacterium]|jgi:hypothetical protein|nr:hypothetical protein [Acidimicrobiia bacterium]
MDRTGWYVMALGLFLSWPAPVIGVVVMVLGAMVSAIVSERALQSEVLAADGLDKPPLLKP